MSGEGGRCLDESLSCTSPACIQAAATVAFISYLEWNYVPSVLWRCWLGGGKGIRHVKTEWCGAGMIIWLERGAVLHMAQLMPLPLTVSCFSKIQIGFTFLILADLGTPRKTSCYTDVCIFFTFLRAACPGCRGKEAVKCVCVCFNETNRLCACLRPL